MMDEATDMAYHRLMGVNNVRDRPPLSLDSKELMKFSENLNMLIKNYGGLRNVTELPAEVVVLSPNYDDLAVKECTRLDVPAIVLADTNYNPNKLSRHWPHFKYKGRRKEPYVNSERFRNVALVGLENMIIPGNGTNVASLNLIASILARAAHLGANDRASSAKYN